MGNNIRPCIWLPLVKTVRLYVDSSSSGRPISEGGVGVKNCHFGPILKSDCVESKRPSRLKLVSEAEVAVLYEHTNWHRASPSVKEFVGNRPKCFRRPVQDKLLALAFIATARWLKW